MVLAHSLSWGWETPALQQTHHLMTWNTRGYGRLFWKGAVILFKQTDIQTRSQRFSGLLHPSTSLYSINFWELDIGTPIKLKILIYWLKKVIVIYTGSICNLVLYFTNLLQMCHPTSKFLKNWKKKKKSQNRDQKGEQPAWAKSRTQRRVGWFFLHSRWLICIF